MGAGLQRALDVLTVARGPRARKRGTRTRTHEAVCHPLVWGKEMCRLAGSAAAADVHIGVGGSWAGISGAGSGPDHESLS
jgi:hypothetical protein